MRVEVALVWGEGRGIAAPWADGGVDEVEVGVGVGVGEAGWWWLGVDRADEIDVLVGVGVVDPGEWGRVHGFE